MRLNLSAAELERVYAALQYRTDDSKPLDADPLLRKIADALALARKPIKLINRE